MTLVERALPGAANSTLTGGGIRQQHGTELNIRLSQLSAETWDQFEGRYCVDPLFRAIGYLFLARTEEEATTLARTCGSRTASASTANVWTRTRSDGGAADGMSC